LQLTSNADALHWIFRLRRMTEVKAKSLTDSRRCWLWILLVAAVAACVLFASRPSLPEYQGKTVYDWMFESRSSDLDSNPGLKAIGSNAVPYLARALAMRKTPYDRYQWVRHPVAQYFLTNARFGLRWTRPSREVRHAATWSLLEFDFEATPALPELYAELMSPDAADRQMVIACIGSAARPEESVPRLVQAWPLCLNDPYNVRHDLLYTLGIAGSNAAPLALPIAIEALDDPKPAIRVAAADALNRWGAPAPEAIPKLVSYISGTNVQLAVASAAALGRITNRADNAIPLIRELFTRSTNDYGRAVVAVTLWRLGGNGDEARQQLESLLTTKTGRGAAAKFLGEMGDAARPSIPALLRASHVDLEAWVDMHDRAHCAMAVLRIAGQSAEAIGVLEEALAYSKNGWVRGAVADELGRMGRPALPLIPALRRAAQDSDREVRYEATKALATLEALSR
jgi:HEAT repeat protein